MELGEFCGGSHQCLGADSFAEFIPPEKSDKRRNERECHDKRYKDTKCEKGEIGHSKEIASYYIQDSVGRKKKHQIRDLGLVLVRAGCQYEMCIPTQVHSREVLG